MVLVVVLTGLVPVVVAVVLVPVLVVVWGQPQVDPLPRRMRNLR